MKVYFRGKELKASIVLSSGVELIGFVMQQQWTKPISTTDFVIFTCAQLKGDWERLLDHRAAFGALYAAAIFELFFVVPPNIFRTVLMRETDVSVPVPYSQSYLGHVPLFCGAFTEDEIGDLFFNSGEANWILKNGRPSPCGLSLQEKAIPPLDLNTFSDQLIPGDYKSSSFLSSRNPSQPFFQVREERNTNKEVRLTGAKPSKFTFFFELEAGMDLRTFNFAIVFDNNDSSRPLHHTLIPWSSAPLTLTTLRFPPHVSPHVSLPVPGVASLLTNQDSLENRIRADRRAYVSLRTNYAAGGPQDNVEKAHDALEHFLGLFVDYHQVLNAQACEPHPEQINCGALSHSLVTGPVYWYTSSPCNCFYAFPKFASLFRFSFFNIAAGADVFNLGPVDGEEDRNMLRLILRFLILRVPGVAIDLLDFLAECIVDGAGTFQSLPPSCSHEILGHLEYFFRHNQLCWIVESDTNNLGEISCNDLKKLSDFLSSTDFKVSAVYGKLAN